MDRPGDGRAVPFLLALVHRLDERQRSGDLAHALGVPAVSDRQLIGSRIDSGAIRSLFDESRVLER
jgi:hypothetical protein